MVLAEWQVDVWGFMADVHNLVRITSMSDIRLSTVSLLQSAADAMVYLLLVLSCAILMIANLHSS